MPVWSQGSTSLHLSSPVTIGLPPKNRHFLAFFLMEKWNSVQQHSSQLGASTRILLDSVTLSMALPAADNTFFFFFTLGEKLNPLQLYCRLRTTGMFVVTWNVAWQCHDTFRAMPRQLPLPPQSLRRMYLEFNTPTECTILWLPGVPKQPATYSVLRRKSKQDGYCSS